MERNRLDVVRRSLVLMIGKDVAYLDVIDINIVNNSYATRGPDKSGWNM